VLLVDLTADCLLLGLLRLEPFGGMVPSGKELTRSRMAILNPFNSLSRSSALIFDEAQTITANAALARSRGGNRSSAMAPTTLCIVAFTVEITPDTSQLWQGSHHRASGQTLDRFRVQNQKEVSIAAGSRLSVVILPPALIDAGAAIATVMSAS
jgi:hypothetical protein